MKKKISLYIAKKLRIRESHYFVKINNFYTLVKNLVKYQNKIFSLYVNNRFLSTQNKSSSAFCYASISPEKNQKNTHIEDYANIPNKTTFCRAHQIAQTAGGSAWDLECDPKQKKGFYQTYKDLHSEESRKLVLFLIKSFHLTFPKHPERVSGKKITLYQNKIYNSLNLLPKVYPFSSFFLYQKEKNRNLLGRGLCGLSFVRDRENQKEGVRGVEHLTQTNHRLVTKDNKSKKVPKVAMSRQSTVNKSSKKSHSQSGKTFSIFYPFLKVKNLFTLPRPLTQRVRSYKISGMKPLHLEVCYKNMIAIFLYSPQKVALPATIDFSLIRKSVI